MFIYSRGGELLEIIVISINGKLKICSTIPYIQIWDGFTFCIATVLPLLLSSRNKS